MRCIPGARLTAPVKDGRAQGEVNVILRGMYGTTPAAHTSGTSFVRNAPRFPRFAIMRAINDTIRQLAASPQQYLSDEVFGCLAEAMLAQGVV